MTICVDSKGNKKGFGGVAIYVRKGLPFRIRHDLHSVDNECLWIELIRKNCRPTLICCVYRAPDVDLSAVISHLRISLANITLDSSDFVLLGDLNVDMMPYLRGNKKEKQDILNFASSLDLMQLITEATRVTKTSLIDVILVNNNHHISDSGVVSVILSDHYLVYCVLKSGVTKAQLKTIEYRSYKNFGVNSFMADLNFVPWHVIENEDHRDDAVLTWNRLFLGVADLHAPVERQRIQGVPLPWMNNKINKAMKDRDFHHRKAVKTNSVFHWSNYRRLRNDVNIEVKSAKSKYYCDIINETKGDPSKICKAVNKASSHDVKSSSPRFILADVVQLMTPASIGKSLADEISFVIYPMPISLHSFQLNEVKEETVLRLLLSLKTNNCIAIDNISAKLLKCGACAICSSVTRLLNLSIHSSKFPEIWKCSKVVALFKSGD